MRQSAGLKLDRLPGETIIVNFRHFPEQHGLGKASFIEVCKHVEKNGLVLCEGSIVDATIISAPSSTKNDSDQRDRIVGLRAVYLAKKSSQWYFGMKMHIAFDNTLELIHSIDTTVANVHDIVPAGNFLQGDEQRVLGDAVYVSIQNRGLKHRST